MERVLIAHPALTVRHLTGSEGPSYDPYSFDEYHCTTPNGDVVVHLGLAVYATVGTQRINATGKDYDHAVEWANRILADSVGYTIEQIERINRKAYERCPEGGAHDAFEHNGFPGEHFATCAKCGKVVDYYFCVSEVL